MCSSVPFAPTSLTSADSPGKFFQLILPLRNTIPGKKDMLSGMLKVYSKNWLLTAVLQRYFYCWRKQAIFPLVCVPQYLLRPEV